jgi:Zn-dependent alcohol dehydrogenase
VRIRVHACGVGMTDVHTIQEYFGPPGPRRLMGHESGGVVDAVGSDVASVEVGTPLACAWSPTGCRASGPYWRPRRCSAPAPRPRTPWRYSAARSLVHRSGAG